MTVDLLYDGLDREQFGAHFLERLLEGYLTEKRLSPSRMRQFPAFLKLLEIGVYAMICRDFDPVGAGKWAGKFMPGRRERIEQEIPYVELDFEGIFRAAASSS